MLLTDEQIHDRLNNKKISLIEGYFDVQKHFEERYGKDTVVVMEVGSFWEVYAVDNDELKVGKTKEIAEILNVQITRRSKAILENSVENPLLCGFPIATFDRYIARLIQENKYTIVIVRQRGMPPKVTRYVDQILSPGVHFDFATDHDDNFLASLVIDKNNGVYSAGFASIDVTTGKSYIFNVHGTKEDATFALDQIFGVIQAGHVAEIILTCIGEADVYEVKQYLEILGNETVQINAERPKISYQNELLKQAFAIESFLSPIEYLELEKAPLTSEALAILLEFVVGHDARLIEKLQRPKMLENTQFLYLGNNPLEQLNIISRDPHELTVLQLVDHTVTSIGRRLLKELMLHPIVNKGELETRYNLSDALEPIQKEIHAELKSIYDLERIARRISLARLHPFEINFLYDSLLGADKIIDAIQKTDGKNILSGFIAHQDTLKTFTQTIKRIFNLTESSKVLFNQISTSIFKHGFDKNLDALLDQEQNLNEKLEIIRSTINDLVREKADKADGEFVTVKQLDKEGHYINLTKSRYYLIDQDIKKQYVSIDGTVYAFSDFSFKVQTTNVKITAPIIDSISEDIVAVQIKIVALVKELFLKELETLDGQFGVLLRDVMKAVAQVDVALSNLKASTKLNLVRPKILEADHSIIEVEALRHPLVEAREENGLYIPNNIVLGDKSCSQTKSVMNDLSTEDVHGVLLYGINSSGKSSLMKSLGVAVLLAQSGMYVPAQTMRFTLMHELFTRIVAKDNFERGLSSFAVEMIELKNIFNRCTPRSLILGDEISHGTETLSAISIVSATILRLVEMKSLFLFTTHLHQLSNIPMLKNVPHVVSVHLSVHYDEQEDLLVFDRTLQPGSGSSIYGLEFAQSLHMDEGFLQKAMHIRRELAGELDDIELLTKKERSTYNKDVYMTSCTVCKGAVDETHHITPQQLADAYGNVGHFHKDHKANLVALCSNCHDKVHSGTLKIQGFVMTSRGLKLQFEERYD